jgi:hypothetical protein
MIFTGTVRKAIAFDRHSPQSLATNAVAGSSVVASPWSVPAGDPELAERLSDGEETRVALRTEEWRGGGTDTAAFAPAAARKARSRPACLSAGEERVEMAKEKPPRSALQRGTGTAAHTWGHTGNSLMGLRPLELS